VSEPLLREALAAEAEHEALTPEAGDRRYFRPDATPGWLLVRTATPPPRPSADWLTERGVRVPRLGAATAGGYLVEDLGDRHLWHAPTVVHYREVLTAARRLAGGCLPAGHPCAGRALDAALFRTELGMFRELWVQERRGRFRTSGAASALDAACDGLARAAAAPPWRVQHRDLHSRNVLLPAGGGVALIDHQDLRPGPLFYDLASLVTDAYLDLPPEVDAALQAEVTTLGREAGLSAGEARRRFQATALQRVLKALGTFARLLRAGREDYAAAEARALAHARRLLGDGTEHPLLAEAVAG
jgi:aminoglycoside/choline kinase family phosphotransferase